MEMPEERPALYDQMLYNMKARAGTPNAISQDTYKEMAAFAGGAEKSGLTSRERNYSGWKDSDFADFLAEAKKLNLIVEEGE